MKLSAIKGAFHFLHRICPLLAVKQT